VANELIAYSNTAGYNFAIWAIDPPFSPSAYEFDVASWNIDYQAIDTNTPGFIPAVCTLSALITDDTLTQNLRNLLQDADGIYFLRVLEGVNVIYNGFLTPDLGDIEVRNGQRFIKLVANDGFQMLDKSSQQYQYTGVRPFTTQIYEMFNYFDFWRLFDGFAISEHYAPTTAIDALKGGLYWTGTIQEGLYHTLGGTQKDYRTFRQVLDDICTTWGLQLFQDKGFLVFRSVLEKTPSWYNIYSTSGSYITRINVSGPTISTEVFTDGTELYKPATRQVFITHNQDASTYVKNEQATYKNRINYFVAEATPTGANHLDYYATLRVTATVPPNYHLQSVEFEFSVGIQFGNYWWNGTNWVTSQSSISWAKQRNISNLSPDDFIVEFFEVVVNNYHLGDIPNIGSEPLYITVTATQIQGDELEFYSTTSTMEFVYDDGNPNETIYYGDNTRRRNGVDTSLNTNIADRWQSSAVDVPFAGEIRRFLTTGRTTNVGNLFWDGDNNLLVTKVAVGLASTSYVPQQYYELELNAPVSYNHTLTWGGVDYKPLNLSFDEYTTTVTYRQWVDGAILTDPNNDRPDQEI
jgi:hypothetical protein